jgi:hypothetical protein
MARYTGNADKVGCFTLRPRRHNRERLRQMQSDADVDDFLTSIERILLFSFCPNMEGE